MSRSRGRTDDGSRIDGSRVDGVIQRPGNRETLNIPAAARMLEVTCAAAGSRKGPRLVAVLDWQWRLLVRRTPGAGEIPGQVWTPCRCSATGHRLDSAKVVEVADRLRTRPRKARRVDVARVAAVPSA